MSSNLASTSVSATLAASTGATDIAANAGSIEGGIQAAVQSTATATVSKIASTINVVNAVNNAAATTASSSSDPSTTIIASAKPTNDSSSSSSTDDATDKVTSTPTSTSTSSSSSSSSSTSAKDKDNATSGSSTTSASSQSTSTSSTSASSSASDSTTLTSAAQTTASATATSNGLSTSASGVLIQAPITTIGVNGQPTTIFTSVYASATPTTTTTPEADNALKSSAGAFFHNKAAVGGVFGAVGLISLIILLAIVLKVVRYRANRKFERELNEQVENEVRSGSPMFGFGKEDDGMSVIGMGVGAGGSVVDPEKAYAGVGSYGNGNTAAYAAYGDRALLQPAYYSPNAPGGAPRRYPSLEHSRSGSYSSHHSYGSLNGTPMNAFAPATFAAPPGAFNGPSYNNGPTNYNYGEYRPAAAPVAPPRNVSPVPSFQTYARPGTPTALTPGGGRASPVPGVAVPRGVYDPRTPSSGPVIVGSGTGVAVGSRSDSPAVPGVGGARRGSKDYVPSGLSRQPTQTLDVPANTVARGNSIKLPNPFDERDSE